MYATTRRLREAEDEKAELAGRLHALQQQLTASRQSARLEREAHASALAVTAAELMHSTEELGTLRGLCQRQQAVLQRLVTENEALAKQLAAPGGVQSLSDSAPTSPQQSVGAETAEEGAQQHEHKCLVEETDDEVEEAEPPSQRRVAIDNSSESQHAEVTTFPTRTSKPKLKKKKKKGRRVQILSLSLSLSCLRARACDALVPSSADAPSGHARFTCAAHRRRARRAERR